jgi:hypothetical protein
MTDKLTLHKVTLNLFEGDFQRLQIYYQRPGAGVAIRMIIHAHLEKLDAKFRETAAAVTPEELARV